MNKIQAVTASRSILSSIIALVAAGVLNQVPAFAQSTVGRPEIQAFAYYSIPLGSAKTSAQESPHFGFAVTHGYGPIASDNRDPARYRVSIADLRLDPNSQSVARLSIGGIDFAARQRMNAMEADQGAASSEWTPGSILAGVAIAGGVLVLLAHEAASSQPPGCNVANVIRCRAP
jgi:hypothetical protein